MVSIIRMSNNMILTQYGNCKYDFNKKIANPSHAKNRGECYNAEGQLKSDKFIIKMGTTKPGLNFHHLGMGFNP